MSNLGEPLMLVVNLPVVDITHPQSNKFVKGVKTKAAGDSKRKGSHDFTGPY